MTAPVLEEARQGRLEGLEAPLDRYECVVIGAGPAGLSAALNLVRARRRVLLVDSNRPRNAATMQAHGFLTRNGISPVELRKPRRLEVEAYPEAKVKTAFVESIDPVHASGDSLAAAFGPDDAGFNVFIRFKGLRKAEDHTVFARTIVPPLASGLCARRDPARDTGNPHVLRKQPAQLRRMRRLREGGCPLALIRESDDLADQALLIAQRSTDLIVFTNGVGVVSVAEEAALEFRGIRVERRQISDVAGNRDGMAGVVLADGDFIPRVGGFVRPRWTLQTGYAQGLELETDSWGLIVVDSDGRTSVDAIYAAGDSTPPGPQQLIVAAGAGARVAGAVNRDLVRRDAHLPVSVH